MIEKSSNLFKSTQEEITKALESFEPQESFREDIWCKEKNKLPDSNSGSRDTGITEGGGSTRILTNGKVFERAGVNFSKVSGVLEPEMSFRLTERKEPLDFKATGISLVIHPCSPQIPTIHSNYRFLEVGEMSWFGGGIDITPYILYEDDISDFHLKLQKLCSMHDCLDYQQFKESCDKYFYLPHREEHRGLGGIFFDYLGKNKKHSKEEIFPAIKTLAASFCELYLPILEKRNELPYTAEEKEFQLLRRGRYVEFNLIYDRGTQFGLKTKGRAESILMSMPPEVKWTYMQEVESGSKEEKLLNFIKKPHNWAP